MATPLKLHLGSCQEMSVYTCTCDIVLTTLHGAFHKIMQFGFKSSCNSLTKHNIASVCTHMYFKYKYDNIPLIKNYC